MCRVPRGGSAAPIIECERASAHLVAVSRRFYNGVSGDDSLPGALMRKNIHPNYREVVFVDTAANFSFLTRSTVQTDETIKWTDGKEYPLVKLDISSASHPFFTGKMKFIDTTGRVEKFQRKYGWDKRKKKGEQAEG
jgi:large subunit ribosomal protein L31